MTTFKASDITPIGWDFRGEPKMDPDTGDIGEKWGQSEQHAHGKIPEPTTEQVKAYTDGWEALMRTVREASDNDEAPDSFVDEIRASVTTLLAELGFPTEMLDQLPPRYFRGLSAHVYKEILEGE